MNYKKMWSEVITASLIIVISAIAIISFIIISDQGVDIYNPSSKIAVSKGTDKISEVLNLLQSKYLDELDVDALIDGAVEGIFESIDDPYTRYMTDEEYAEAIETGNETYSGVGIHISLVKSTGEVKIVGVMPASPAKKAGLKAGDVIKKVDDLVIDKDTFFEASKAIMGDVGTTVTILVERQGKELTFDVVRDTIEYNDISSTIIDNKYGYIKIFSFEQGVYENFKSEYEKIINNESIEGLIIDLRDNPGGFVDETVKIADILCGSGTIIKQIYGDGTTKIITSDSKKCELPLVILVNQNSASASEILAGAVKDLNAGKVVGTVTFGKGIMQSYIKLQGGGAVAITVARYYTASGKEIQDVGIEPDVESNLKSGEEIDFSGNPETDSQLKDALKVLSKMK